MLSQAKLLDGKPKKHDGLWLSVSKINTFNDCKLKYRYCYIERLPRKEWPHHTFGNFAHEILEVFHKNATDIGEKEFSPLMADSFKEVFVKYKDRLTKDQLSEMKDILNKYLIKIVREKKSGELFDLLSVERGFYVDLWGGKILLNGFIDREQKDADGVLHIVDYKTTKNKRYLKKDSLQLLAYAYVKCVEDPELDLVRASFILLRHGSDLMTNEYSRDRALLFEEKLIKYANEINDEKLWRPKTTRLCKFCDYLDVCKYGKSYMDGIDPMKFGAVDW
jgi:RecB family exonuclease